LGKGMPHPQKKIEEKENFKSPPTPHIREVALLIQESPKAKEEKENINVHSLMFFFSSIEKTFKKILCFHPKCRLFTDRA
jgi:hypothetical protein